MIRKPFEQWLFEDVEIAFNIERIKNLPLLMEWLDVPKNNGSAIFVMILFGDYSHK